MKTIISLTLVLLLIPTSGFAETRAKKAAKRKAVQRVTLLPTGDIRYAKYTAPVAPAPSTPALIEKVDAPQKKILNFRISPYHLVSMISDKEVIASFRGDLDFVLGSGITLGPSVIYKETSRFDPNTSGSGSSVLDEYRWEVGLLSNLYLTGSTSVGGFILRPSVYWIDAHGERNEGDNVSGATATKNGVKGNSEFVFQHIMPSGFNFEIGAGVSYHFVPYSIDYPAGGTVRSEPSSRLSPTITAGVGWAF